MGMQAIEIMRPMCRVENPRRKPRLLELAIRSIGIAAVFLAPTLSAAGTLPSGAGKPRVAWGYVDGGNLDCGAFCFSNPKRRGGVYVAYLGTGSYEVELEGMGPPGPDDVQVSAAQGGGFAYCMTAGWSVAHHDRGTVDIIVNCYDVAGNPTDDAFAFLYQSRAIPLDQGRKELPFSWRISRPRRATRPIPPISTIRQAAPTPWCATERAPTPRQFPA